MYHEELEDAKLHEELEPMDEQLAAAVQAAGCPYCGGKLHVSNYPRKPRGAPGLLPAGYARRRSFTCARCRRRQTPPSLRFLGRKVYVGVVVVVLSALLVGGPRALVEEVRQQQGVSTRTLKRWQKEWSTRFAASVLRRLPKMTRPCSPRMDRGRIAVGVTEGEARVGGEVGRRG